MEGKVSGGGRCCITRYSQSHNHHKPTTTTHHYNPYTGSKIDHIMLRFRPIAPKPVVGGPTKPNAPSRGAKGKRKTTSAAGCTKRRKKSSSISNDNNNNPPSSGYKVTLPLLPEIPDLSPRAKTSTTTSCSVSPVGPTNDSMLLWFGSPSSDINAALCLGR